MLMLEVGRMRAPEIPQALGDEPHPGKHRQKATELAARLRYDELALEAADETYIELMYSDAPVDVKVASEIRLEDQEEGLAQDQGVYKYRLRRALGEERRTRRVKRVKGILSLLHP